MVRYDRPMGGTWTTFFHPTKDAAPEVHVYSYGPAYLGGRENDVHLVGPKQFVEAHPELFGGGTVSSWEGYLYWAFSQKDVLGPREEGRWQYQGLVRAGGRLGQATPDFIIFTPGPRDIACRVQSYFHAQVGAEKEASDVEQVYYLQEQGYDVIDAFGEWFIFDETGEAAKAMARRVIRRDPSLAPGSGVYLGDFS